jgi:hypothetical protein
MFQLEAVEFKDICFVMYQFLYIYWSIVVEMN